MPPEEYEIPLIMQRNDLSSLKFWLLWQKNLKEPRNPHPQPRRKIIQYQLGKVTSRIPMSSNLFASLHTRDTKSGRGTVWKVNQGYAVDFLPRSFLVDDQEVGVPSLGCGMPDFLEWEVGAGARSEG